MKKNLNLSVLLDFYGEMLTEKQRDVMYQYYHDDLSLAEIAANFNISRQGVRDSLKRAESYLLELEHNVGFAEKYSKILKSAQEINRLAKDIIFYDKDNYINNPHVLINAQKIAELSATIDE